jgi:hypothetical protein
VLRVARSVLFIVPGALAILQCGNRVNRERLIGEYVFSRANSDTLGLKADSTFYYSTYDSGTRLVNTGKWKLSITGTAVDFEDVSLATDGIPAGRWQSDIRVEEEKIRLLYGEDSEAYYEKIEE